MWYPIAYWLLEVRCFMNYSFLDKEEYNDIPVIKISDNKNNLPFWIAKMNDCNDINHRHEFVQIVFVSKGRLKHVINNNSFDVVRGDIFVIPPYIPHYIDNAYGENFEIIEFEFIPEFINEKFSSLFNGNSFIDFAYLEPFLVVEQELTPRLHLTGAIELETEKIFAEIIDEYEKKEADFELIIKALAMKLLILVGREFKKNMNGSESQEIYDKHRDALKNAICYVDTHFCEDISLDEVSKVAMFSPSYFRYLFKQMTNKTFTEYLNEKRVNKAVSLLIAKHDRQILDICYEVGYNNVNYFNRIFKQTTGVSPRILRNAQCRQYKDYG
jgi:AraC-like DNA-binding protein/mannose-6-phosphate isomerase-like protein (cupin superfamily)